MVIDAAALAALQTLPENPPILPSAPTWEEYDWSVYGAAQEMPGSGSMISSPSTFHRKAYVSRCVKRGYVSRRLVFATTGLRGSHLTAKKRRGQWSGREFFDLSSEVCL